MKTIYSLVAGTLLYTSTAFSQLSNGSIAPNFTLTDIDGVTHTLYDYLDQGKTVYIDFFAAHCPYCWNYKNTGAMEGLYNQYGPNGSVNQDIVILAIEHDPNNGYNELNGISGNTRGNWVAELPYPIINPEGATRTSILTEYKADFYPLIYGICPDRRIKNVGTLSTNGLYYYQTSTCLLTAGIENENEQSWLVGYDAIYNTVHLQNILGEVVFVDMTGKQVTKVVSMENNTSVNVDHLMPGLYVVQFETLEGSQTAKISIP